VEEKYQLSNSFLMEMMDINEQLMEASMEEDATKKAAIQQELQNIQEAIYAPVKEIIEHYTDGVSTKEELLQVKEYYYKKKYLSRILAGLK
jgi:molecular chaperone HscB